MQEITTTTQRGIPTAINIDHYGYVVPDLDQAVAFFTDVLGFELLSLDDPITFSDDSLARWYHVHPRASARFAFVRYGPAIVELTEWQAPDQNTLPPSNSDLGGRHFAIAVTDVDAAIAYLAAQPGVTVFERSVWNFVYFTTPWGMTLQVVQPLASSDTGASEA
ncbi:MAG TPA: VOC family protein [Roseiflexaceae bacterium]|nr:VOC family protein [Roseiflexaceae bacterium]